MKGLTKRQRELLDYIDDYIGENRYSPSYHDIMRQFDYSSPGTVSKHLKALQRKGAIVTDPGGARSVMPAARAVATGEATISVPLIGSIQQGVPLEIFIDIENITITQSLVDNSESIYAIRVRGESLLDEGMIDGDLIIIGTLTRPHDGDTVVAELAGDEIVVKRHYLVENYIRLESRNPNHQPLIVRENDTRIIGIVLALIRSY